MPFGTNDAKIFFCIIFVFLAINYKTQIVLKVSTVLSLEKQTCPFCFGKTFCNSVDKVRIKISLFEFILDIFNQKSYFTGIFENEIIGIKRLATPLDFDSLEDRIAYIFDIEFDHHSFNFYNESRYFYDEVLALLNQSFHDASYKLRLCPNLMGVSRLFDPVMDRNENENVLINIWTSLILNPEPLVLQVLSAEEGWPVPKYLGSCGRVEFVEHCGKTIQNYVNHPWLFRVHIVEQLLWMARNFTFRSSHFGVYLRDISFDNVAIDSNLRTRVIDLEHIVLVDKDTLADIPPNWAMEHISEHFECRDCLVYSPMEICSHHISDHNFYAICKEFLHSIFPDDLGLLHSLPNSTKHNAKIEQIKFYVEECIDPSNKKARFEIAENLRILLEELKAAENFSAEESKSLL